MARVLLILLLCYYSQAFNLDTRTPIIKLGGTYSDSYFGFSVAQHRTKDGEPVILVGAPKDKNLQPGTAKSGALYRCSLSLATRDCVQVETDGRRHDQGRLYGIYDGNITRLKPPLASEIKEDQWLGVSLSSQGPGGKVLVCAHRYTVRDVDKVSRQPVDSKRAMLGMCYILEEDLTLPRDTSIGARNLLVVREALRGKRLELINDFDNHAKFGVCQVGTAAAWAKSGELASESEDYAMFGAPGCFTWRGNILGQRTGTTGSYETAVREDNNLEFTKHGHLGLAVTSGRYFDAELRYVSGAPHLTQAGKGSGEIYFFTQNSVTSKLELDSARTLRGGSFGAGFGYSLETMDLNGDGRDDLLVGAPFTDHPSGEGGSVFIYINKEGSLRAQDYIEIRGSASESQFGLAITRLGDLNKDGFQDFAVGAPYEDRGVVYVFLGSAAGLSGVRLEDRRRWVSAAAAAAQVITGKQLVAGGGTPLPANLGTFGSSLSGGIDLDNNNYPDLVVGSYGSNSVVGLLARPIINIATRVEDAQLQAVDPGRSGCPGDPDSPFTCFPFSACFRLESTEFRGMMIRFKIIAEPAKPVSRVWLRLDTDARRESRQKLVEHNLLIQDGGRDYCTSIHGYLSNYQTDLQTPVKFSLSYTLVQDEPKVIYDNGDTMVDIDKYPILNQQQALRTFFARFQKNCGSDDLCQAQLIVKPSLADKNKELARSKDGIYQLELGTLPDNLVILHVSVQNLGEAAYEAKLGLSFPPAISFVGLAEKSDLADITLVNSTFLNIDLGNPFKGKTEKGINTLELKIKFAPKSIINETLIIFEFLAETSSELVVDASTFLHCVIVRRAEVEVAGRGLPSTLFYGGTVRGESALIDVSEIGPQLKHIYQVSNKGPSEVDVVTIKIKWPYQMENGKAQGKWLLYLTEYPLLKNGKGDCTLPPGYLPNPLNLTHKSENLNHRSLSQLTKSKTLSNTGQVDAEAKFKPLQGSGLLNEVRRRRRRREVEHIVAPMLLRGAGGEEQGDLVVRLDCDRGTAKCLTITCQVYNLQARDNVVVEVRSRLWNSTLVEDYTNIDRVEIVSKASVIIDSVYTQDLTNDFESILTIALPDRQLEPIHSMDWWIYVVAAAVGLLVLVLIVLVLYKLGFFRRQRPLDDDTDYMVSANFEKVHLNSDM